MSLTGIPPPRVRLRLSSGLIPDAVSLCTEQPLRRPADHVPLKVERVVDRSVGGEEALRRGDGLEAPHLPLSSPGRQMRVFGAVVFAQATRSMTIFQAKHVQCRAAGSDNR